MTLTMVEPSGYVLHMSEEDDGEVVRAWFRFDERDPLWGAEL